MTAATTGSHSLDADTKAGEKYFRHQLKMLCPRIVEKTASSRPDHRTGTIAEKAAALDQASQNQRPAAGRIYDISIYRCGHAGPNHPADQRIDRHSHCRHKGQNIAIQLGTAGGIRISNGRAAQQRDRDRRHSFPGKPAFQENAESQTDPDHLCADNGGGACHRSMAQGFKPNREMDRQKQAAQAAQYHCFSVHMAQFLPYLLFSEHHRCHQQHRPQQAKRRCHSRRRRGKFYKYGG